MVAKLQADDWRTLRSDLMHLATEIARHGSLPASSCSGGYSSGHIIITSEDESIDHDSWAKELDAWIEENCPPSEVDSTQVNERRDG
jgi:hypothetical protein